LGSGKVFELSLGSGKVFELSAVELPVFNSIIACIYRSPEGVFD
jgi:hypothetical protein